MLPHVQGSRPRAAQNQPYVILRSQGSLTLFGDRSRGKNKNIRRSFIALKTTISMR
jgi:hypothetical protein